MIAMHNISPDLREEALRLRKEGITLSLKHYRALGEMPKAVHEYIDYSLPGCNGLYAFDEIGED